MEQKLTPAVSVETSLEQKILQKLEDVEEQTRKVGGQLRDMRQMLVGTSEGPVELPHGRLVQIESRSLKNESRIDALEKSDLRAAAYWNAARILGHVVTGLLGGATLAIVQWLIRVAAGH